MRGTALIFGVVTANNYLGGAGHMNIMRAIIALAFIRQHVCSAIVGGHCCLAECIYDEYIYLIENVSERRSHFRMWCARN